MKIVLISPNSIGELTGGGLYLRGLVQSILRLTKANGDTLKVICKSGGDVSTFSDGVDYVFLPKHKWADLFSRLLGSPTFLLYYAKRILTAAREADILLLHNSRTGRLLSWLLARGVRCKTITLADNVEYDLVNEIFSRSIGRAKIVSRLERLLVKGAEELSVQNSDCLSFITAADQSRFLAFYDNLPPSYILPVTIPGHDIESWSKTKSPDRIMPMVLFTGTFSFPPNVDAVRIFDQVSAQVRSVLGQNVVFTAAGRSLSRLDGLQNITLVSDPSAEEMEMLFQEAALYLAPVAWGSGMKTKVAEALSYSCPVLCLPNAAVGYEEIASSVNGPEECLMIASDAASMADLTVEWLRDGAIHKRGERARQMYLRHLSNKSLSERISKILYPKVKNS